MIYLYFVFLFVSVPCFSVSITLPTGGGRESVDERRIMNMSKADIEVVYDESQVKNCKVLLNLNATEKKEFWESSADVCERAIKRLKKVTSVKGGDTLLFLIDYRGCPEGIKAIAYNCKL